MTNDDRFVLYVHYFDPATTWQQAKEPTIRTRPTFYQALSDLLALPMDSFDPYIAKRRGMDHYIHEASIMDMRDGKLQVSVVRFNSEQPVYLSVTNFLLFEENVLETYFPGTFKARHIDAVPEESRVVAFLQMERGRQFLFPTPEFSHLARLCHERYMDYYLAMNPNQWIVAYDGIRLSDAIVSENGFAYPAVRLRHFLPTEEDALRMLLSSPSSEYDLKAAMSLSLPYHWKDTLVQEAEGDRISAAIFTLPREGVGKNYGKEETGRILLCPQGWKKALDTLGMDFASEYAKPLSPNHVKLDFWKGGSDPELSPTLLTKTIHAYLGMTQDIAFASDYVAYLVSHPKQTDSNGNLSYSSAQELRMYYHGKDFGTAFSQILVGDFGGFDQQTALSEQIPAFFVEGGVMDANGSALVQLKLDAGSSQRPAGVYLTLLPGILDHPHLDQLQIKEVIAENPNAFTLADGSLVLQVAQYHNNLLVPTPLYTRIDQVQALVYSANQVTEQPTLLKPYDVNIKAGDEYMMTLLWNAAVIPPGSGSPVATFTIGFPTADVAISALADLPIKLFDETEQNRVFAPMRIVWAQVARTAESMPLVTKTMVTGEAVFHISDQELTPLERSAIEKTLSYRPPCEQRGEDQPDSRQPDRRPRFHVVATDKGCKPRR